MDEVIKNICQALKEEADAVISYTDKIAAAEKTEGMEETSKVLSVIRLDEVEHIQNLTLEITKLLAAGPIPTAGNEENE